MAQITAEATEQDSHPPSRLNGPGEVAATGTDAQEPAGSGGSPVEQRGQTPRLLPGAPPTGAADRSAPGLDGLGPSGPGGISGQGSVDSEDSSRLKREQRGERRMSHCPPANLTKTEDRDGGRAEDGATRPDTEPNGEPLIRVDSEDR